MCGARSIVFSHLRLLLAEVPAEGITGIVTTTSTPNMFDRFLIHGTPRILENISSAITNQKYVALKKYLVFKV